MLQTQNRNKSYLPNEKKNKDKNNYCFTKYDNNIAFQSKANPEQYPQNAFFAVVTLTLNRSS